MRPKNPPFYTDLDLNFIPHPLTGDLKPKINEEAIERTIRHLIKINILEIPFNTSKKSSLKNNLFDPINNLTKISIRKDIEYAIQKMEPRVKLISVVVNEMSNGFGYIIYITYSIKSLDKEATIEYALQRKR